MNSMPDGKALLGKGMKSSPRIEDQILRCLKCGGRLLDYEYLAMAYRRCEGCDAFWLDETIDCDKCG